MRLHKTSWGLLIDLDKICAISPIMVVLGTAFEIYFDERGNKIIISWDSPGILELPLLPQEAIPIAHKELCEAWQPNSINKFDKVHLNTTEI